MLSHWGRSMDVDLFVDTMGNIPAGLMNYVYLTLKPLRLNQQKYLGMVDILDNPAELENFLRMERWIFDSPDQAGEAFRQFIKDFYRSEEHTSELQSLMRISYAVFCLKKKKTTKQ